jgi:protoporphyrinogen oxidase
VRLLFLRLARPRVSTNASIYVPDPRVCISRISEPKNRSDAMTPPDETSLLVEVPCFTDDALHRLPTESLAEHVQGELESLGLMRRAQVVEWRHHFLPHAYPVYSLDYPSAVGSIVEAIRTIANLDTLGRGGRFLYGHLHDQLRAAKDYVRGLPVP